MCPGLRKVSFEFKEGTTLYTNSFSTLLIVKEMNLTNLKNTRE